MNNIKERFAKDFESSNNNEISFDLSKLEANTNENKHKVRPRTIIIRTISCVLAGLFVLSLVVPAAALLLDTKSTVKEYTRKYSLNEISIAETNTFKKLNSVAYPNELAPIASNVSAEEMYVYNKFSSTTYSSLLNGQHKDNVSYSIVGLYSVLNELYGAISDDSLKDSFDDLLGMDEASRASFYVKIMRANSYVDTNSTTQIKNAAFFNNDFIPSETYTAGLQDFYCEAYQADFSKDQSKIADWVNKAVDERNFIDPSWLGINKKTEFILFSTLYFKNAWKNKFLSSNNIKDRFYLSDGTDVRTTFMRHTYYIDNYYDYGSYVSIKDYYYNGNASVTYIVPKKTSDDIYKLVSSENIFSDKVENKVVGIKGAPIRVHLKAPKFKQTMDMDFKPVLERMGFASIFNKDVDSFKNAFSGTNTGLPLSDYNAYLQSIKQRNQVAFNEDGTVVKSVSMASGGMAPTSSQKEVKSVDVNLECPFIYIIKDKNDIPIFVGHVDNPAK